MAGKTEKENHPGLLNLVVILLSIYVLASLAVSSFVKLPAETLRLLDIIDNCICVFFLIEFAIRFSRAERKLHFMKWGWINLLSSIPALDVLRAGRTLRLIRLIRVLRAFRSARHLINFVYRDRTKGLFTTVAMIAVVMIIFSAIAILQVETDPASNIRTAEDAIWWAYVTITTVGYGDKFPVTTEGRVIAAALMTIGVGLFGTLTGFVASWFAEGKSGNGDRT
jgi:voltage-gated potassium channel